MNGNQMEKPWYREPWPWIIMAPPATAVIAGVITIWIAFSSADGLVADDYYKQGLAINRVLARKDNARRMGVAARVEIHGAQRVSVMLGGRMEPPTAIVVRFTHVAHSGSDRELRLDRVDDRRYEAVLPQLPGGRWRVSIEDAQGEWRVAEDWTGGSQPFTAAAL
jgi:uncharacterized protein